ncbi:MAG: DUF975 family protein [Flavobacterium sp.]|nr:DUF975 family protein [Flavobacterium sp.]
MSTANTVLMQQARESLAGKWGQAIGAMIVYMLLMIAIQLIPVAGAIIALLIGGPMAIGLATYSLALARNEDANINQLFVGFNKFGLALAAYFLMLVFILLWMLLLIIPGIIAALSYSMTFYILADEESMDAMEAIDKSKAMMNGYKWKYFCLGLRFVGWALLCILTFGIGFLWLVPYMQVSNAKFYEDVKANYMSQNASPATEALAPNTIAEEPTAADESEA